MFKTMLTLVTAIVATLAFTAESPADSNININNGGLYIETDASHDLVVIGIENDRAVVHVLQFNPTTFPEVPNIFDFSEAQLIAMADEYRVEERSLSRFERAYVYVFGGNDVVWVHDSVQFRVIMDGDELWNQIGVRNFVKVASRILPL